MVQQKSLLLAWVNGRDIWELWVARRVCRVFFGSALLDVATLVWCYGIICRRMVDGIEEEVVTLNDNRLYIYINFV